MSDVRNSSLGQHVLHLMKKQPKDKISQINAQTGEKSTYLEVLTHATSIAAGIRSLAADDLVAIVSNFNVNSVAAFLGSIFHGVPVHPMDPSLKQLELEHMFRFALPKLVFVESRTALAACNALESLGMNVPVYLLDEEHFEEVKRKFDVAKFSDILVATDVDSFRCTPVERPEDQIAVVIPSSGTTGYSKGVAITHKCVLLVFEEWSAIAPVREGLPFLGLTPLFWVTGIQILLFSVSFGFQRIYTTSVTPENVLRCFDRYKPGWSIMSPMFLARTIQDSNFEQYDTTSLKYLAIGGAMLSHSTISLMKKKMPWVYAIQAYGFTEAFGSIVKLFYPADIYSSGTPVDFCTVKIVDVVTGKELGPNQEGEITVKTKTLMKCYINNEENTKNSFDSDGFFHTGDVGYMNDSKFMYITGRIKELIKVKSHQVSPYEIEDVIRRIPGVKDVGVVGIPHEIDQYHPRAMIIKNPQSDLTEEAVIEEVADKLSETKQLFGGAQFVDFLPRTPTGKLKRDELLKMIQL